MRVQYPKLRMIVFAASEGSSFYISFMSSEHVNEKGDGPYHNQVASLFCYSLWKDNNDKQSVSN